MAQQVIRIVLGAALGMIAAAKLLGGHDPAMLISAPLFFGLALAEFVMAAVLILGVQLRCVAWLVCSLSASGIVASVVSDRPCGCLGSAIKMGATLHAVMAAGVGFMAVALLYVTSPRSGEL
jgi:hypothetical protein